MLNVTALRSDTENVSAHKQKNQVEAKQQQYYIPSGQLAHCVTICHPRLEISIATELCRYLWSQL